MADIRALLIDIDGVLTVSWRPLPGAVDAFKRLRDEGYDVALLTNTTSRPRAAIASVLSDAGFDVDVDQIVTAPVLTAAYLAAHHPDARCLLLNSGDVGEDLAGVTVVDDEDEADTVVLGGAGDEFSYAALDRVFRVLQRGAPLVAMHRNLFWRTDQGLQLDSGAFLLGLERAANVEAEVVGKPAEAFFATAVQTLGVRPEQAVMVGDDIEADVLAAQRNGITGVLVKTGKYVPGIEQRASGSPNHVVDSFADVPALLTGLTSPAR